MAQGDYLIQNQSFPSFRSDLNSTLEAINTSNSGTSRPSSAVAGTIWLDTTSATTPTLKFYDGADDISLATLDYSANTVNWIDSTVIFDIVNDTTPQLGGDLDVNGNSLVSTSNGDITFTPDGTGKVVISGLNYPTADGTADQVLTTDGSGNLSFADISGGTTWQSSIKTANFTAVAGEGYWINTTSGAVTMTLPASASVGDTVEIVDYARTWNTNNVTVDQNGLTFQGGSANPIYDVDGQSVRIIYSGATKGWIPTSDDDVTNEGTPPPYSIDFLVIAGGGGGGYGNYHGSGGGAGGYRTSTQTVSSGTTITVTVGDGGAGGTSGNGGSGSNSSISGSGLTTITSAGGAGGVNHATRNGLDGGSGSGGSFQGTPVNAGGTGGSGNVPSVSPSQGNNGGNGSADSPSRPAGGGGGAGATGGSGSGSTGGAGGNGTASSITGSSVTRAGGGGGSAFSGTGGAGGSGGGGAGSSGAGTSGTINTGGGGGGSESGNTGGSGGKGVVILSMPDASYTGTTTGSPTVATGVSGKTVLTFTGTGSYTA
jgi:hypothetical protein